MNNLRKQLQKDVIAYTDAVALGPLSTASSPRGPPEDNLANGCSDDNGCKSLVM